MPHYIGIDVGTTSITALILDAESGCVIASKSVANDSETTPRTGKERGRSEWDVKSMAVRSTELLSSITEVSNTSISGIGVTGQQHGMVLLDDKHNPIGPFIGWQDRRCLDPHQDGRTYLESMIARGGSNFATSEYLPARGYMGSTLFWLSQRGELPRGATASFAPDYLVGSLCDQGPITDPTNAAGSGVFNVIEGAWDSELLHLIGLSRTCLPDVQPSCTWAGALSKDTATATGLPEGLPVTNACGDNQASFAGSVSDYAQSVLVNIGTGGQISVYSPDPIRIDGLLVRPYLKPGYLLVGAGMTGGRSYAVLERFIEDVGQSVFGTEISGSMYDVLTGLAERTPPGAEGLVCEPIFTGSLASPARRGILSGISDANLTAGNLARALLEGMVHQFLDMYGSMLSAGVTKRNLLVGAGNGLRKNELLRALFSSGFEMSMKVVRHEEEAALGAALSAAVADGMFKDVEAAGLHCINYTE
ncbi:MAG: hypothetical protein HOH43_10725 [Candidatus Latescibacteria bacterium]|jgi:sugar (pentulose or hexulose) kinase|nr:hypothetical protein [Candidatus Latescibacterota bacterium]